MKKMLALLPSLVAVALFAVASEGQNLAATAELFACIERTVNRANCSGSIYTAEDVVTGAFPNCGVPFWEPATAAARPPVRLLHPNIVITNTTVIPLAARLSASMQYPLTVDVLDSVLWTKEPLREFLQPNQTKGLRQAWFLDPVLTADMADEPVAALLDLSKLVLMDSHLNWNGFGTFFRRFASVYDGKVVGLPVSAAIMLFYYRRDFFSANNITVPATWEEVVEIAERYNGTDLDGTGRGAWGFCMSRQPSCYNGYTFQSIQVPFMQAMGTSQGFHFDPDTLEPLVNSTGTRYAAELYRRLARYTAPTEPVQCLPVSLAFVAGNCLMAVGTTLHFKYVTFNNSLNNVTRVRGKTGTTVLPGSMSVMDRATGRMVPCSPTRCPYGRWHTLRNGTTLWVNSAPYAGRGAFTYAINRHSTPEQQYMAYRLCARRVYADAMWPAVLNPTAETTPVRSEMVDPDNLWRYTAANYDANDTLLFMKAVSDTVEHPNIALNLRIDGALDYYLAVDKAAVALTDTGEDVGAILDRAQARVLALYANRSREWLRQRYFKTIERKVEAPGARSLDTEASTGMDTKTKVGIGVGAGVGGALLLAGVAALVGALLTRSGGGVLMRRRRRRAFVPSPSPQCTLVVTDVEGSTNLWESLPGDVMQTALQLHDAIARRLLAKHNGYESATEGDSFIAAFPDALSALRFSVDLQAELAAADWPVQVLEADLCRPVYAMCRTSRDVQTQLHGSRPSMTASRPLSALPAAAAAAATSSRDNSFYSQTASGMQAGAASAAGIPSAEPPSSATRVRSAAQLPFNLNLRPHSGARVLLPPPSLYALGGGGGGGALRRPDSTPALPGGAYPSLPRTMSQQVPLFSSQVVPARARSLLEASSLEVSAVTTPAAAAGAATAFPLADQEAADATELGVDAHRTGGSQPVPVPSPTGAGVAAHPLQLQCQSPTSTPPRSNCSTTTGATLLTARGTPSIGQSCLSTDEASPTPHHTAAARGEPGALDLAASSPDPDPRAETLSAELPVAASVRLGKVRAASPGALSPAEAAGDAGNGMNARLLSSDAETGPAPSAGISSSLPAIQAALLAATASVGGAGGSVALQSPLGLGSPASGLFAAGGSTGGPAAPQGRAWTWGDEARATWQLVDSLSPGAVVVFRGLRVRVGLHSGVKVGETTRNRISSRVTFCGIAIRLAKSVSDTAHGGMVVLSDASASLLLGSPERSAALAAESAEVWHLGRVLLAADLRQVELFQVVTPLLAPRLAVQQPPRVKTVLLPGVTAAPAGTVALARLHVAGLELLRATDPSLAAEVQGVLESLLLETLPRAGGYLSEARNGGSEGIVVAFLDPLQAVAWALCMQADMLNWDWSPALLAHESFEAIEVDTNPWRPSPQPAGAPDVAMSPCGAETGEAWALPAAADTHQPHTWRPVRQAPASLSSSPPPPATPPAPAAMVLRSLSVAATASRRRLQAQAIGLAHAATLPSPLAPLSSERQQLQPQSQPQPQNLLRQASSCAFTASGYVGSGAAGRGAAPSASGGSGRGAAMLSLSQLLLLRPGSRRALLADLEGSSPSLLSPLQPPQADVDSGRTWLSSRRTTFQGFLRRMRPSVAGEGDRAGLGSATGRGSVIIDEPTPQRTTLPSSRSPLVPQPEQKPQSRAQEPPPQQQQQQQRQQVHAQEGNLSPAKAAPCSASSPEVASLALGSGHPGAASGLFELELDSGRLGLAMRPGAGTGAVKTIAEATIETSAGLNCAVAAQAASVATISNASGGGRLVADAASPFSAVPGETAAMRAGGRSMEENPAATAAAMEAGKHLLFRGPRTKAVVELGAVGTEVCRTTGRLLYRGRLAKHLAKLAEAAQRGQVLCTPAVYNAAAPLAAVCGISMSPYYLPNTTRRGGALGLGPSSRAAGGPSSRVFGRPSTGLGLSAGQLSSAGLPEDPQTPPAGRANCYLCSLVGLGSVVRDAGLPAGVRGGLRMKQVEE